MTSFFSILSFDFAQRALWAIFFLSLTCGLLSPLVVLKQRSYLGDTLSHLVFPGVVAGIIASQYFNLSQWGCLLVGAAVTALVGTFLSEWILKKSKCPPDSSAVVCLSAFFALGVVFLSKNKGLHISPESIFFGDVLTLTKTDVTVITVCFWVVFFLVFSLKKHWDAWLVDSEFAEIAGFKVSLLNKLFPLLLTLSILSGIFAVGGLMISALITLPTLLYAPRSVFSFSVILCSVCLGVLGFVVAFLWNLPVGPCLVLVGFSALILKTIFKK